MWQLLRLCSWNQSPLLTWFDKREFEQVVDFTGAIYRSFPLVVLMENTFFGCLMNLECHNFPHCPWVILRFVWQWRLFQLSCLLCCFWQWVSWFIKDLKWFRFTFNIWRSNSINCYYYAGAECRGDGDRIIGGYECPPHSQPWQIYLTYDDGQRWCGASLINERWAVSAAHCYVPWVCTTSWNRHKA